MAHNLSCVATEMRHLRWALGIVLALAAGGCSKDKRDGHGPTRVAAPPPVVVDAAPAATFDADGWGGIRWSATPDTAKAALTAAGFAFVPEEQRAYFANPQPGQPMHTNGLFLRFDRGPMAGSVNFESWHLEGIVFTAPAPYTREQGLAEQAALVQRFGPPAESIGTATAPILRWTNATTTLLSAVQENQLAKTWGYQEVWQPVPVDGGATP
jgi:hypothetical protein